jgi:hypothetical protein
VAHPFIKICSQANFVCLLIYSLYNFFLVSNASELADELKMLSHCKLFKEKITLLAKTYVLPENFLIVTQLYEASLSPYNGVPTFLIWLH